MSAAGTTIDTTADVAAYDPYRDRSSVEFGFRSRRFQAVQALIEKVLSERGRCDILDLGGTETYWLIGERFIEQNRRRLNITVVNTEPQTIGRDDVFTFVEGSATAPDLCRGQRFDLVHSNSVIEHVGVWRDMEMFAANARRLADRYYIQTPNYWFPYEPHFRFPGFQYLPESVRARLIMRFSLGFFRRIEDRAEADDIIYHHRLLSTRQMRRLFPDAVVSHEKFMATNKSIIAIRG
ncbi:MAG: class I SAM-dependent methyltransferase [Rhizobiaceae bacterium]|nr:class I SAM-dependent methyltransferase [Rhizobiaceae bacterium]